MQKIERFLLSPFRFLSLLISKNIEKTVSFPISSSVVKKSGYKKNASSLREQFRLNSRMNLFMFFF